MRDLSGKNRWGTAAFQFLPTAVFFLAILAVLFLWEDHDGSLKAQEDRYGLLDTANIADPEKMTEKSKSAEDQILEAMTLEEKVAQLFMVTPEAITGVDVATAAGDATREAFSRRPVGGIIYFADNLQARAQTETMLADMQKIGMERLGFPVLLGTDEEGGRVTRIAGASDFYVTDVGPMGSMETEEKAKAAGATIGSYLAELGFNTDFAPVADVAENPDNPIIGDRAFGTEPQSTGRLVAAAVQGFQSAGILTTLKHFPGHGSTLEDSHDDLAYNKKTPEELWNTDLLPFQTGIEAGADMVMVGHISLPNVLSDDTPASLSRTMITDYLRGKLHFDGVVVTDSMSMGAITNHYTSAESAKLALEAGADLILMPADFEEAYQGILSAVQDGSLTEERIDTSVRRILKMKQKL